MHEGVRDPTYMMRGSDTKRDSEVCGTFWAKDAGEAPQGFRGSWQEGKGRRCSVIRRFSDNLLLWARSLIQIHLDG